MAAKRFVSEMVYGIQAAESVPLTEVGRTLEEDIPLRKTEWRLSRNLQRPDLEAKVQKNLLRMALAGFAHDGDNFLPVGGLGRLDRQSRPSPGLGLIIQDSVTSTVATAP